MGPAVRFWLLVLFRGDGVCGGPARGLGVPAGAVLGEADAAGYVVSVFVALVSIGLLVWSLTADTDPGPADGRPEAR